MFNVFGQKNFLKISCIKQNGVFPFPLGTNQQNMQKWLEMVDLMMSYILKLGGTWIKKKIILKIHMYKEKIVVSQNMMLILGAHISLLSHIVLSMGLYQPFKCEIIKSNLN